MSTSNLEQLQLDITSRLEATAALATVHISAIRPRSQAEATQIQTTIDRALAGLQQRGGKSGAALLIQMPTVDAPEPNVPGPQIEATINIRILENPLINMGAFGTQLSAETIGLTVLAALHHWDPGTSGSPLYADARALEPNEGFPGKIVYDGYVKSRIDMPIPARAPAPRIDRYGAQIALTGDGSIYYTTDGTLPHAGNDAATLYTTPFTPDTGSTVRAAAYQSGKHGSDVTQLTLN